MPKAPFERIFSLSERKKILAKVFKDKVKVIVKINKNLVFEVKAEDDIEKNVASTEEAMHFPIKVFPVPIIRLHRYQEGQTTIVLSAEHEFQ